MADQKKLKKSAAKAYDKAEDAVTDARAAVAEAKRRAKKLAKKSRPSVKPLENALDDAASGLKDAKKTAKGAGQATKSSTTTTPAEPRSIYTPPLPDIDETSVQLPDGHDAHVDLHAQTLVALRALARTKGVTNVSRYTKAALIEKIEQA
ncbi:Rho termination factor N-terminal domain-containing protein [Frigoribacterium sp. PhB24]|uniref:Rho termination factor N-terminal domain-containing protein n=1 Tax=Frigoribacterium sp. PhB24 TaxID=2485204 RepID=UPI000F492544|nr:Rho termination factor N-terminal domain-containing protein [Frigoribacterium sp. PhB24]ROS51356.1 Rho termination factor-like protein [Frigoribacterium sp. PhB24]